MDLTDDYPWFHYRIYLYICSALAWTVNFLKTEIHLVHALKVSREASYTHRKHQINIQEWLTARHWECLGQTWEQGSLTRDFSSVSARFYILWLFGFLSWNEFGNRSLQNKLLSNEFRLAANKQSTTKISKIIFVHCLPGYKLQPHFYKKHCLPCRSTR